MKYLVDYVYNYNESELFGNLKNIRVDKQKKINCLVRKKDKLNSILGELLLKRGLYEFYNLNYNFEKFIANCYGKPFLARNNIFFNISHSNDLVCCVFSNKCVGIDVEQIRKVNLKTINYFATEKERKYILGDANKVYERLFEIYTLKEAYFKMLGSNLNNIKNVEFKIDNKNVKCSDKNVELHLIKDYKGYIIASCKFI